jgi:superfamily II DNA or RNA helicase
VYKINYLLRPYQIKIEADIRAAFRSGHRSPLLVAPTGSGKTLTFSSIAEQAGKRGKRILILAHRRELIAQDSEKLMSFGVDHGIIAPGHCMTHDHVQIASVQTLIRRIDRIKTPDLIIVDECHHSPSATFKKILTAFPDALKLGVTATPVRLDGKGLGDFYDTLVYGPSVRELQDQGFLSRTRVYSPPIGINLDGMHRKFGDYIESEMEDEIDRPQVIGNAVEHYLKICPGIPAIAFCPSIKMAENVATEFRNAGIHAESIDGTLDDRTRKYRIEALGVGRIQVLTSCEIISEGVDIPVVGAAILLRPTMSFGLHRQQIGRAMRPYPGKTACIILDHVGNVGSLIDGVFKPKHGFPEDDVEWSLEGIKKKNKENEGESYRQCESCYFCYPAYLKQCPQCGAVPEKGRQERSLEFMEGELQAITPEMLRVEYLKKEEAKRNAKNLIKNARTLKELQTLSAILGYKPQWAYYVFKSRIGKRNQGVEA